MKLRNCLLPFAALAVLMGLLPSAQGQSKEDSAHEELRGLMKEVLTAYNKGDLDKLTDALDDEVVVTWQNGRVNKGRKEVKAYYEEMTTGPKRVVEKSSIEPVPDDLSIFYNDSKTAIAWGSSKDHYKLTDGTEFDQETRWSATVVKKDGKWKVVSVHISVNMFDNPILNMAIKKTGIWIGSIAGGIGLLVGLIVAALIFRSRSKPTSSA
jgi:uncharacterized protein (TIGR02246 family)